MKRFKSKIGFVFLMSMMFVMFCFLSGCMAMDTNITINKDDTVTVDVFSGFSTEFLNSMNESADSSVDVTDDEEIVFRTYNGVEYQGASMTTTFKSLDEFNSSYNDDSDDSNSSIFESVKIVKDAQGYYTLTIKELTYTIEEYSELNVYNPSDSDMGDMYFNMSFAFPSKVYQVQGEADGVVVDGNKVTVNKTELKVVEEKDENTGVYVFSTNPNYVGTKPEPPVKDDSIHVTVDKVMVEWPDAKPFIDANDRTMVPLRAVAEALNLKVEWDSEKKEAIFYNEKNGKYLVFTVGEKVAHGYVLTDKNGTKTDLKDIEMDTEAVIVNDRTYAPIRYLAEYFMCNVNWNGNTNTVEIQRIETMTKGA